MAHVFIPTMRRDLTAGGTQVYVEAQTVREIINRLEAQFPGFRARVLEADFFRPDIAVAIDGEMALDVTERVDDQSEVHFIPPIAGGV